MHIITIASRKGGTGKTTTAGGVAQMLASKGLKVLLVDLDTQVNAALMFLRRVPREFRVEEWFNGAEPRCIQIEGSELYVLYGVGAHPGLTAEELRAKLGGIQGFDYLVFDCPPSDGLIVRSAIAVADTVLAMAEPGDWAIAGAIAVSQMVRPDQRCAFVVSRYSTRTQLSGQSVTVLTQQGRETFTVVSETKVPSTTSMHHGFPKRGKASLDMWDLVTWITEG